MTSEELTIRTVRDYPVATLVLFGELTPHTTAIVRAALRKNMAEQPAALIVDLGQVTTSQLEDLSAFRDAVESASDVPGIPMILLVPDPHLRELMHLQGLDRNAPIVADRETATQLASAHPLPRCRALRGLPGDPRVLRDVRRAVVEACDAWGIASTAPAVELIASELVSNAIEHAGSECDVTIAMRSRHVHVAVRDASPLPPRLRRSTTPNHSRGRGLLLVDDLSEGWGSVPAEQGKLVWAAIAVGGPDRSTPDGATRSHGSYPDR